MTTFCLKCGTQAVDEKSLYCNKCGEPLIHPTPETSENCPQSKEVAILPETDSVSRSQKSESERLKSKIPLKRKSMLLPAILIFTAFVLVILAISQTGILNLLSSNESITTSQEPANGIPIPSSLSVTGASTLQTPMINAPVTSTLTPTPSTILTITPATSITTATTNESSAEQVGIKNILETAEADGRFTIFVSAVKAAGLNDMLSGGVINGEMVNGPDMFTVFVPTDDAFRKLSTGSMDTLLKDPQGDLLQILLYHIVPEKVKTADLTKLTSIETLQGGALPISVSNNVITVDSANVIIPDIECSNGIIHGVDTVMLPPA